MQSLSGSASDKQAIKNAEIELNCTAGQAKWLFGMLEGKGLNDLKESTMAFSSIGPSLGSLMSSEDATTPSPIVLRHVLRLADFYDFPFFPRTQKRFCTNSPIRELPMPYPLLLSRSIRGI
jgi:hypothetical protein